METTQAGLDSRIGARIRDLRMARNLTLDALAQLADVSRAMLSRIERGESSPTAQLLAKITSGLGITLSMLFAATERAAGSLSRRADQPVWQDPASLYRRRNVSPSGTGSPVEITEVEFPAGAVVTLDNQHAVGADQHVWVLEGTLDLTVGADKVHLESGDCLAMRLDQPIVFHNSGTEPVRYAVVLCKEGFRT